MATATDLLSLHLLPRCMQCRWSGAV